jgi:hypothetical protein
MSNFMLNQIPSKMIRLSCLFCFLLIACKSKYPNNHYTIFFSFDDVHQTVYLSGKKHNVNNLFNPRSILNLEDYIVISERNGDTLLVIIDKEDLKFLRKTGIKGNGPGEIGSPWALYNAEKKNNFWVHSLTEKKMNKFDATSSSFLPRENILFTGDMFLASNFLILDSSYMLTLVDGKERYIEYSTTGNKIKSHGIWENLIEQDLPSNVISSLYQGRLNVSPDKRYCVLACSLVDVLEILDRERDIILTIHGPINHLPEFKVDNSPGYPMLAVNPLTAHYNYHNAVLTDGLIYAAFSGATSSEVNNYEKYINDIFTFDYQGKLKAHYHLDISISDFTVDEVNKKIYALSHDLQPNLVVFDF